MAASHVSGTRRGLTAWLVAILVALVAPLVSVGPTTASATDHGRRPIRLGAATLMP